MTKTSQNKANATSASSSYEKDKLKERVKELDCLYKLTTIVKDGTVTIDRALEKIIQLIPPAWQYPEITCTRIQIGGTQFVTKNFKKTKWKQTSDIIVDDKKIGSLEIYYLEEKPVEDEGPFLIEERRLLDAISDLISKFIGDRQTKQEVEQQRKKLDYAEKYLSGGGTSISPSELSEKKQDWEVILDLLVKTDPRTLLRMVRKMTYHLYRFQNEKITNLLGSICPVNKDSSSSQWCGINMPNPRQDLDSLKTIQKQIFQIAKETIPAEEISLLFQNWMRQDKARPLLLTSQKPGVSLVEITDELNRLFRQDGEEVSLSPEDRISIKTALIRRFFTDRLEYVNVAKAFIEIEDFVTLLDNVVGPVNGSGKLGGKTSGIILAEKILNQDLQNSEVLKGISFPKSWYISSDTILNFIHYNDLDETFHIKYLHPDQIRQEQAFLVQVFKNAAFPREIMEGFRRIVRDLEGKPIIIRSSSLLEDSFGAAFSGKYKSLFIANTGSEDKRLYALMDAIAEVYASTFGPDPIEYRRERGLLDFSEEMGILIQGVVGVNVGPYYLPIYGGVAFSKNEFQWSPRIQREDGMIRLVPGLGTRAVDRVGNDYPILVSPKKPKLQVNALISERMRYSPRYMDVINLKSGAIETVDAIELFKEYADDFPNLHHVISMHKDDRLVNPPKIMLDPTDADMVVTFSNLFEKTDFLKKIDYIITTLEEKIGTPVDVEFASDGKLLYVLQCRPQSQARGMKRKPIPKDVPSDKKLFAAGKYVTTGQVENVEYIVYITPEEYIKLGSREEMQKIATIVNELNNTLPRRQFILMGPGRWGSRGDIRLGVPVKYGDINNTSLLVEIAKEKDGYTPELSFGTHFFQDLVEAEIKYLPLYPDEDEDVFHENLLCYQTNYLSKLLDRYEEYEHVVHVVKASDIYEGHTLSVIMDGEAGEALAYFKSPDHWSWRMQKVEEIAEALDPDVYGVESLYLIGSTKEGTAGPASDIDLLVHFIGTEEQKERLVAWLESYGKKIDEENKKRTGLKTSDLLDFHLITEEDIKEKNSWASHITSPYMSVKKISLKKSS